MHIFLFEALLQNFHSELFPDFKKTKVRLAFYIPKGKFFTRNSSQLFFFRDNFSKISFLTLEDLSWQTSISSGTKDKNSPRAEKSEIL